MDAPSKSLVDYLPSPICPEPQPPRPEISSEVAHGPLLALADEDEKLCLREQLECSRREVEEYRERNRFLEDECLLLRQRLHAAQSKAATPAQEVLVPSLLEALMMVSKMADEAMYDDA